MRRFLALAVVTTGLVLGTAHTADALSPVEPTTTTRPVVVTEPEGVDDDPTTTAPTTTWPPIGGPDGDVVDPSVGDRLLPGAAVGGAIVLATGVVVTAALTVRRRSS